MNIPSVQVVSECFINPIKDSNQICYLTPWDISLLSMHYMQCGLLFKKPTLVENQQDFMNNLLNKLKDSLSFTLVHFHPLVDRLVTVKTEDPPTYVVFVDCKNSPGVKFMHATLDMTISDILSPIHVPSDIVHSFFDHHKAVNHDGHTMPLLTIKVTDLVDGVFIACSMNHSLADGTSIWNFFSTWSEIFQAQARAQTTQGLECKVDGGVNIPILRHPIHDRWFPQGCSPLINLPYKHHDEFICRYDGPKLIERFFHFSANAIAELKAKANKELSSNSTKISSFQSLSAFVWRSMTRARNLSRDNKSDYANKSDGKVFASPGREGGGSIDLEVCLLQDTMTALESDEEFMSVASAQWRNKKIYKIQAKY